jgi:hypothetical protein
MTQSRIRELLEEILESGCKPEEVCTACPELLPVVLVRLRQVRHVERRLEALFPSGVQPDDGMLPPSD